MMIEDLLLKHNLSLLNDGSYTYMHSATGSSSAIDLSIASPSLYLDLSWEVVTDLHGSDHFHICIHSYTTAPPVTNGTWNGPPILQKLLQIWAKIILMIWKIPSSILLTSLSIYPIVLSLKANCEPKNAILFG